MTVLSRSSTLASASLPTSNNTIVTAINAFNDNYIWAITTPENSNLVLVDPGDAKVCIAFIEKNNLILTSILITHHHHDHTGGIDELANYAQHKLSLYENKNENEKNNRVNVYGPANENITGITHKVNQNDTVYLSELACGFSVLALPGHTLGHIAYVNDTSLFCGDTLFSGGCGRLFEGTPAQMHNSLDKLKALNGTTLIYCAHEYTQVNLNFALTVEPNNEALQQYYIDVVTLRQQNQSTIPSSIAVEKAINPFLRCQSNEVINAVTLHDLQCSSDEVAIFTALREWKNSF